MFNASNTYASKDDVQQRLTSYVRRWATDVDAVDGYADTVEDAYYEAAIEYANVRADEALEPWVDITPRPANDWIRDRVVDIAAARVVSLGGRDLERQLQLKADDAEARLDAVRDGVIKVPGLDYTKTLNNGTQGPYPFAVINVRSCR